MKHPQRANAEPRVGWRSELSKRRIKRPACLFAALLTCVAFAPAGSAAQSGVSPPDEAYGAYLQEGRQDLATRRYASAKAALEAAVALDVRRPEGWAELGILYGRLNDFRSAEMSLRRSLELNPKQASAHYYLGLALVANPAEKLDWPGAILEFREALKLRPEYPEAANYLGVGQTALGQTEEAITTLGLAVHMNSADPAPHFNLALALERMGENDAAVDEYRKALLLNPDYSEADSALGKLLLGQDRLEEAEARLRDALRINPDLEDAHYALGRLLRKEKKLDEAKAEFDQAMSLGQREPNGIESTRLSNGALERAARGDLPGAESDLRRAIELRADYGVPHFNLGLILADEQHMVAAAQQLLQAISLMPGRAQAWISLAKVQTRLCDLEGARASLDFARALAPAKKDVGRELQGSSSGCTKSVPALAGVPTPWISSPQDAVDTAAAHDRFAGLLQARGDWLGASGEWLRSLKLAPRSVPARLALAECLEHMGDREHAILEERRALLAEPASSAAHLALGLSQLAAGSSAEARQQLEQTLVLDPGSRVAADSLKRINHP